ncbi:hypothetical protein O9992_03670 [Vibrio lentus]|nr:hypothetical protein [Vibrio lentus]
MASNKFKPTSSITVPGDTITKDGEATQLITTKVVTIHVSVFVQCLSQKRC